MDIFLLPFRVVGKRIFSHIKPNLCSSVFRTKSIFSLFSFYKKGDS